MAKLFLTSVRKVIVQAAGGLPTFVYKVARKASTAVGLSLLLQETRRLSEAIGLTVLLREAQVRSVALIISAVIAVNAKRQMRENILLAATLNELNVRRCVSTVSVRFDSVGTWSFTVPAGVTSLFIEGVGGGASGGGGGVGGGGSGGGGGGKGTLTLAVVAGDVISVTVGAGAIGDSVTNTAGLPGGSTIIKKNGTVVMTVTGGNAGNPGGATSGGAAATGGSATGTGVTSTTGNSSTAGSLTAGGNGGNGTAPFAGTGGTGAGTLTAATSGTNFGAGGGGATSTFNAKGSGSQGVARITFSI